MPINPTLFDYKVDTEALKKTPWFWRWDKENDTFRVKTIAFLEVLFNALKYFNDYLQNDVDEKKTFLDVTGQHLSLENYLNNLLDSILRRIYITENDASGEYGGNWYLQTETDPENKVWYLQTETDPIPKTFYLQPEIENIVNFTINIPASISYDEDYLRGLLDNYVLATKNYEIVTF